MLSSRLQKNSEPKNSNKDSFVNSAPSSSKFCKDMNLQYWKKTQDLVIYTYLNDQPLKNYIYSICYLLALELA